MYNAGDRCGPRSRRFVEVTCQEALENAGRKNVLWVFVLLHAYTRQKVSGWSGFNISARNKVEVRQDSVGYLPTIYTPATTKGTLAKELQKSVSFVDVITQTSACMIDAMAFVQRLMGARRRLPRWPNLYCAWSYTKGLTLRE